MNHDPLALESARAIELLGEILAELKQSRRDTQADSFLEAVLCYVGSLVTFSVSELIDGATKDEPLRQALGDLDAYAIGRELADRENHVVLGRRLVKRGRSTEGNRWRFEPA